MLYTLGKLELSDTAFPRPKLLVFLSYLAFEGAQDRKFVAELFWGNRNDPLNSLSAALSQLRKHVPGTVEANPSQVWTNIKCDASQFLKAVEASQHEEAFKLYRGVFLQGVSLPDWSAELEEWVYGTREALAEQARACLLALAEAKTTQGLKAEGAQLAEHAYRLPSAPPASVETLSRIHSLLSASQSSQAKIVMQEIEDLGIDFKTAKPAQIENKTKPANAAESQSKESENTKNNNLPKSLTSFIGRDAETVELLKQLANPDCHLLTLVGMGGIGKSRLALQLARDWLESGKSEGVYFVKLEALTSSGLIPSAIADALGISLEGTEQPLQQVIKHIGDKKLLLVLDNFEQLLEGAVMLKKLLEACPNLKLLVTSRERLNLSFEYVFALEGLAYPKISDLPLQEALSFEALQLFVQRAKHAKLDFFPTEEDTPYLTKIAEFNQGSPLGLELAAAWIKMLTLKDIAQEIAKSGAALTATARDAIDRHQSLKVVFEYSWKLLTHKEQEVMRKLSVFQGGFTREAASQVTGATLPLLARLVDKSLLRVSANGRYEQHPLIYQYCHEKLLEDTNETENTFERHCTYYMIFLEERRTKMQTSGQVLQEVASEINNIIFAWDRVIKTRKSVLAQTLSKCFNIYFDHQGQVSQGIELLAKAIQGFEGDIQTQGYLLARQAWLFYLQDRFDEGETAGLRSLDLLRPTEHSDWVGIKDALNSLAAIAWLRGNYTKAKTYWEELVDKSTRPADTANMLGNLALIEHDLGNDVKAEANYRKAIELLRQEQQPTILVRNLSNFAEFLTERMRLNEAQTVIEEGIELAKVSGSTSEIPYLMANLILVKIEQNQFGEAERLCDQTLDLLSIQGGKSLEATIYADLARIFIVRQDFVTSQQKLLQSLRLNLEAQDVRGLAYSLFAVAEWYIKAQQKNEGVILLAQIETNPDTRMCEKERAARLLSTIDEVALYSNGVQSDKSSLSQIAQSALWKLSLQEHVVSLR